MAIVPYTNSPTVTDSILFDLYTPGLDGCFTQVPESFDTIKIFFISRSQTNQKDFSTSQIDVLPVLQRQLYEVEQEYCTTEDQLTRQQILIRKDRIESEIRSRTLYPNRTNTTDVNTTLPNNAISENVQLPTFGGNTTYYSEAVLAYCAGETCAPGNLPMWIYGEDNSASLIQQVTDDPVLSNGHFRFIWEPGPIKEGDYYICYSYTMRLSAYKSQTYTTYLHFYIRPDIKNEVAIPSHGCPPEKYMTLLTAYMPRMYDTNYAKQDKSVFTLTALNNSVAKAFTGLDDQASRLIDILNANCTPEPYLNYLAQMFSLKLMGNDITRWRGQIITAVPQFKRKGTLESLMQAFDQAGIFLSEYYQYWQVSVPQIYTQTFEFTDVFVFELAKYTSDALLADYGPDNLFILELAEVALSPFEFRQQSTALINFIQNGDGTTSMVWDSYAKNLQKGDRIKITYVTENMTAQQVQLCQYFLQNLILQDDRDYFLITPNMPPKNWNMRLITSNDSYFDSFVPTRNPFYNPVVFGQIRTEFPYSENVYNMDEYNGSLRNSTNPGDMANDYEEGCSGTISADYGISVVVQDLSDFRLDEVRTILNNYTPFHSICRTLNFVGSVVDYILPPVETINWLMKYDYSEYLIAGDAQMAFNRKTMWYDFSGDPYASTDPATLGRVNYIRTDFAEEVVTPIVTGSITLWNKDLILSPVTQVVNYQSLLIDLNNCLLEVLDGVDSGSFDNPFEEVQPYKLIIKPASATAIDPVVSNSFTYRISNLIISGNFSISNSYQFSIADSSVDYLSYDIKTVYQDGASIAWQVRIGTNNYPILYVNNNTIFIENNSINPLSTTSATGFSYSIINPLVINPVVSSTTGIYDVCKIAKVTSSGPGAQSLASVCVPVPSQNMYFTDDGVTFYKFYSLDQYDTFSFYVLGYNIGLTSTFVVGKVYNRLTEALGTFEFDGMLAQASWPTFYNSETVVIRSDLIPEQCLLDVDYGVNTYTYTLQVDFGSSSSVTPTKVGLLGYFESIGTVDTNPSGLTATCNLYKFNTFAAPPVVPALSGQNLYYVTRAGQEIWSYDITSVPTFAMGLSGINEAGRPVDFVKNNETIKFSVEFSDGQKAEGEFK
jgi:hypothetical protein